MSAAPAKFRFDLDLGRREDHAIAAVPESAMTALVNNARAEGYRDGLADGERAASVRAAERLVAAATAIADRGAALNAALDDRNRQTLAEAVDLAAAIGRKLASALVAAHPVAEIEALIAECLAGIGTVPHLVIRCAPELAEAVREIAQARIATTGFAGRLVVLGDPDQALGDARLEWVDGGIARDRAALEAEIDRRIAAFVAARQASTGVSS